MPKPIHFILSCVVGALVVNAALACSSSASMSGGGATALAGTGSPGLGPVATGAAGSVSSSGVAGRTGPSAGTGAVASPGIAGSGTAGTPATGRGGTGAGGVPGASGSGVAGSTGATVGGAAASAGSLGAAGGSGGAGDGAAGAMAAAGGAAPSPGGSLLPPSSDYGKPGPFADAKVFNGVGPNRNYTLFRPDASLGKDGFKHAIVTWGNGIATTPNMYTKTLTLIATHGFVVIAVNDTQAEEPALTAGLEWLIEQNTAAGEMQGKLDITREATIGYSWGGGAAIDTAYRPNVLCTASLHGMPPRKSDAFDKQHSPLLLYTSTGDSFVTASGYVTPNYQKSKVQTFYATLDDRNAGHLYVADAGSDAIVCGGGAALGLGECKGAPAEQAPTVAWFRLWVYGDEDARKFFYGDDCVLCKSPWTMPQRKNWP